MAQCVVIDGSGALVVSAADPCTSLVVVTPAEYGALSRNPFNLSEEDGTQIAFLIVGVWVTAFCLRALFRVISGDHHPTDSVNS